MSWKKQIAFQGVSNFQPSKCDHAVVLEAEATRHSTVNAYNRGHGEGTGKRIDQTGQCSDSLDQRCDHNDTVMRIRHSMPRLKNDSVLLDSGVDHT